MLAQDPETQALQPTTSTARHARDKRRPYASLHGASPHENLNCRYAFDRTDGIAPEHQGIVCCYLALMYCERLLKNPDFHPSEFFDTVEAWLKLWRQLPADQRAEPLAANREEAPYVSVLHRAMTGAGANPDDPEAGSAAFIEQWGACLEAVPAAHRAALLQGTPNPRNTALRRALETGHWAAVVAWAGLLRWVTPSERDALTPLTEGPDHQLTQAVRRHAQQDPAAYQAALEALREPLPANAWAWMQAQAPAPRADRANTDD